MEIGPTAVLAALLGILWSSLYVFVRGTAGGRLPLILLASMAGAAAGDWTGGRVGLDILRVGDFRFLAASIGAWAGIAIVVILSVLGPSRRKAGP